MCVYMYAVYMLFTLLLTLCGQKSHRGGLRLSGLVLEEAHSSSPYFPQPPIESTDAGSTNCLLTYVICTKMEHFICGMTNYPTGPNRTTSDPTGPHHTLHMSQYISHIVTC